MTSAGTSAPPSAADHIATRSSAVGSAIATRGHRHVLERRQLVRAGEAQHAVRQRREAIGQHDAIGGREVGEAVDDEHAILERRREHRVARDRRRRPSAPAATHTRPRPAALQIACAASGPCTASGGRRGPETPSSAAQLLDALRAAERQRRAIDAPQQPAGAGIVDRRADEHRGEPVAEQQRPVGERRRIGAGRRRAGWRRARAGAGRGRARRARRRPTRPARRAAARRRARSRGRRRAPGRAGRAPPRARARGRAARRRRARRARGRRARGARRRPRSAPRASRRRGRGRGAGRGRRCARRRPRSTARRAATADSVTRSGGASASLRLNGHAAMISAGATPAPQGTDGRTNGHGQRRATAQTMRRCPSMPTPARRDLDRRRAAAGRAADPRARVLDRRLRGARARRPAGSRGARGLLRGVRGDVRGPRRGAAADRFSQGAKLAHAVRGFFRNGGRACWIARVAGAPGSSTVAAHLGPGAGLRLLESLDEPTVIAAARRPRRRDRRRGRQGDPARARDVVRARRRADRARRPAAGAGPAGRAGLAHAIADRQPRRRGVLPVDRGVRPVLRRDGRGPAVRPRRRDVGARRRARRPAPRADRGDAARRRRRGRRADGRRAAPPQPRRAELPARAGRDRSCARGAPARCRRIPSCATCTASGPSGISSRRSRRARAGPSTSPTTTACTKPARDGHARFSTRHGARARCSATRPRRRSSCAATPASNDARARARDEVVLEVGLAVRRPGTFRVLRISHRGPARLTGRHGAIAPPRGSHARTPA